MRNTKEVLEEFRLANSEKKIHTFEIGIQYIDPSKIIALDFLVGDIENDRKMLKLKESVALEGWTNKNPETFSVLQLPSSDLVVTGGGNHRAYLANKLKEQGELEFIKAAVSKVVNMDELSTENRNRLIELENLYNDYECEMSKELITERNEILHNIG